MEMRKPGNYLRIGTTKFEIGETDGQDFDVFIEDRNYMVRTTVDEMRQFLRWFDSPNPCSCSVLNESTDQILMARNPDCPSHGKENK
jgi:hypothetical protein